MNKLKTIITITVLAFALLAATNTGITANAADVVGINVYRLYNPNNGEHFYTTDANERDYLDSVGWNYEGVAFISSAEGQHVYRLYNPNSGEHHYTTNSSEVSNLYKIGWDVEGVAWNEPQEGDVISVYRLYNPYATGIYEVGAHHYTKDTNERDYLVSLGWNYEGIGWYAL